ncbi:MAG: ribbon-helix-helix protein, CopG family [Candidatus Schekmanbacteria bacterium]|nr:ribbon-helix-helix protein, CopG family [Candidatus Schekmanbacteria bacterium]
MRTTKILSISLPPQMLEQTELLAKKWGRTKSELLREALRRFIQEEEWRELQRYGAGQARKLGIRETDVERLIHEHRQARH